MKAVGVIAEYNPFHSGHAWHIKETRRRLGEEKPVVCVMSGNWVQRGECALTDKWTRTAMALRGGADLVLELPLPWAISSAENFARGGVEILKATGVVDTISFGSESGRIDDLLQIAEILNRTEIGSLLRDELDKGISFAEARERTVGKILGERAKLLRGANDNLGVEYIKAAGNDLSVMAIPRQGAMHDDTNASGPFVSASYLRHLIRQGKTGEAENWMRREDISCCSSPGCASMENIERAMLARLRQMKEKDFEKLPDSGKAEGLPARMERAAAQAGSLEEFFTLAKTRRYAHSRLRRLALWGFLGLMEIDRPDKPAYLRVLGANKPGRDLLREMKTCASIPVLTKPAHIRAFPKNAQLLFETECRGTDLYGLCFDTIRPCGMDFTTGPVLI